MSEIKITKANHTAEYSQMLKEAKSWAYYKNLISEIEQFKCPVCGCSRHFHHNSNRLGQEVTLCDCGTIYKTEQYQMGMVEGLIYTIGLALFLTLSIFCVVVFVVSFVKQEPLQTDASFWFTYLGFTVIPLIALIKTLYLNHKRTAFNKKMIKKLGVGEFIKQYG
jgi:hypothetical protein